MMLEQMGQKLRGTQCIAFNDVILNRKSTVASRPFSWSVLLTTEMAAAIATYAACVAEKMRRQGLATANLIVFVETNRL